MSFADHDDKLIVFPGSCIENAGVRNPFNQPKVEVAIFQGVLYLPGIPDGQQYLCLGIFPRKFCNDARQDIVSNGGTCPDIKSSPRLTDRIIQKLLYLSGFPDHLFCSRQYFPPPIIQDQTLSVPFKEGGPCQSLQLGNSHTYC